MLRVRQERYDPPQQKGYSPEEILKGLCDAVARNFKSSINKGKDPFRRSPWSAACRNSGVVRAIRDAFGFSAEDVVVPRGFAHMGALGAAAAPRSAREESAVIAGTGRRGAGGRAFPSWPPLYDGERVFLRDRVQPPPDARGRPRFSSESTSGRSPRTLR